MVFHCVKVHIPAIALPGEKSRFQDRFLSHLPRKGWIPINLVSRYLPSTLKAWPQGSRKKVFCFLHRYKPSAFLHLFSWKTFHSDKQLQTSPYSLQSKEFFQKYPYFRQVLWRKRLSPVFPKRKYLP